MDKMDNNTLLIITGNKAFYNLTQFMNPMEARINKANALSLDETYDHNSGLFMYSKRRPKPDYDYNNELTRELFKVCPIAKLNNRVFPNDESKLPKEFIEKISKSVMGTPSNLQFLKDLNTNIDLETTDTTHILNITSTIASMMGLSFPFSNIGNIIPHSYVFESHEYCVDFYQTLAIKYYNNMQQIMRYRERYYHGHSCKFELCFLHICCFAILAQLHTFY